ncbi:MAG: hypothetical protein IIA58_01780 [Candidatus Marinimicrobia bacterium]|nr:hypothetical protein [Candidatus Neomarinimicrobiota bacterium]
MNNSGKFAIKFLMIIIILLGIGNDGELNGQLRKDPRSLGMGGAYTTIARDFFSVGVNPANLGVVRNYIAMQLIQFNFGVSNSSLSLFEYNKFNGADLEEGNKKEELLSLIPDEGLSIYFDSSVQPVLGNISWNNMAVTTDIYSIGEVTIPKAPFEIIFNGNEIGVDYSLEAGGESLTAAEIGFSNGGLFGGYLMGYTARIIKGIAYFGVDSSDANFLTDSSKIVGDGEYIMMSSRGGLGYSLDIGLLKVSKGGVHFGIALINLLGKINWSDDNERIKYFYTIDNLNLNRVAKKGYSALVTGDNERTLLKEKFSTALPRLLRIGASTSYRKTLIAFDYIQGFSDRLYSSKVGKFSLGMEYYGESRTPFRFGISAGGKEGKEIAVGLGVRLYKFKIDIASAMRGAYKPANAKGFELSISIWSALGYRKRNS